MLASSLILRLVTFVCHVTMCVCVCVCHQVNHIEMNAMIYRAALMLYEFSSLPYCIVYVCVCVWLFTYLDLRITSVQIHFWRQTDNGRQLAIQNSTLLSANSFSEHVCCSCCLLVGLMVVRVDDCDMQYWPQQQQK